MPKNILFLLKNCKNRKRWGLCPQTPIPPAAGGSASRPQHQSSYIARSSLCICPQSTDSFGINQKTLFSCNYSGSSAPGFRRRKNYAAFRMSQTTEIITIGFNFLFCSPTHFALAPPLPIIVVKCISFCALSYYTAVSLARTLTLVFIFKKKFFKLSPFSPKKSFIYPKLKNWYGPMLITITCYLYFALKLIMSVYLAVYLKNSQCEGDIKC